LLRQGYTIRIPVKHAPNRTKQPAIAMFRRSPLDLSPHVPDVRSNN